MFIVFYTSMFQISLAFDLAPVTVSVCACATQQDVNISVLCAQVGSNLLHNCHRARWSRDLALSLNVSETLTPIVHPLEKGSQRLVINIHFQSNLALPNGI